MTKFPFAAAARRFTNQFDRDRFAYSALRKSGDSTPVFNHIAKTARGEILPES